MKAAFLAFTCILIAGISNATADELLDLETRDLAEMKTVSGITVVFDPGKISMVYTLPRSSGLSTGRSGSTTNILGLWRATGRRRNSRQPVGPLEFKAVLHNADIDG